MANDCNERVQVAESSTLFTTLDVILAANYQERANRMFELLHPGLIALMFDLFVFPEVCAMPLFLSS